MSNIDKNVIKPARRYSIFRLSTFDCITEEERREYNRCCNKKLTQEEKQKRVDELVEEIDAYKGIRVIPEQNVYVNGEPRISKIIARFEDECARLTGLLKFDKQNPKNIPFIKEIIVMEISSSYGHDKILKQIIDRGLMIGENQYVFYSSSANQQKNRQICLLERSFYEENKNRLMCGLTIADINNKIYPDGSKGCNTGKYLAYTSLIFSKSVELSRKINIDEVLVLPEFETFVQDRVNYLDMESQIIEEKDMLVPVNHMDGAGIFLPGILPQSAQIRGGWIKGCIFPFDFRKFIIEKQSEGKIAPAAEIVDVWGNPVSVDYIRDKIKVILNGSQLKMWKYYKSWDDYKAKFKENKLEITVNNTMHYRINNNGDPITKCNYQFLQTIPRDNMTDERIECLAANTIDKLNRAKSEPRVAMELMGINMDDKEMQLDPFWACIKEYPSMLQSSEAKRRVKSKMESERKEAMSGRLLINGYYNYICPDLYAACEHWFCGEDNPEGLIPRNHVYNGMYSNKDDIDEVCCLRSPHLSDCEHGIRQLEKSDECKRWFSGLDTVISTHDLLTKTIQCDVDGDEALITPDKNFITLLDRSKLPLYYEMKKASPQEVDNDNIYSCLTRSFDQSVIGEISNCLTKYLNMAEKIDINFVRVLTAYNNFCIDYPKSHFMPDLLQKYQDMYDMWKDEKHPEFFHYAKDVPLRQCCTDAEIVQRSNVNRISHYVKSHTKRTNTINVDDSHPESFNPMMLQSKQFTDNINRKSQEYYDMLVMIDNLKGKSRKKKFREEMKKRYDDKNKALGYDIFYHYCNHEISKIIRDRDRAAAYLLDIEYFQEDFADGNKDIIWNCFGDVLYKNLFENLQADSPAAIRRFAYHSRTERNAIIESEAARYAEEIMDEEKISISQAEYDMLQGITFKKKYERDWYLLFILYVLYKRTLAFYQKLESDGKEISSDQKKHFKLWKNRRDNHSITIAKIDTWIEHKITAKGLKRLQDAELIKIEDKEKCIKVYPKLDIPVDHTGEEIFSVGSGNPLLYYYQYSGDVKVKRCDVCGKLFKAVRNAKTCSPKHARLLKLKNKNSSN